PKKKLFNDDDGPKKSAFEGDFFKRDEKKKVDPFGEGGFKKESGTKKLAELFGEGPPKARIDPFAKPGEASNPAAPLSSPGAALPPETFPEAEGPPRIPSPTEAQQQDGRGRSPRDGGDPQIREELQHALAVAKPGEAFERVLRKYARINQQWKNSPR